MPGPYFRKGDLSIGYLFWLFVALIIYTCAGHPFLLALFGLAQCKSVLADFGATPSLTMLIAAYNEEDVIARVRDNCLTLGYPAERPPILVAVGGIDRPGGVHP
jgi:biofilm PGA synthesis N-glycosyltransferase PgaC